MPKPNAMLARLEAKWRAQYLEQLAINSEIDRMAVMLMLHTDLQVGPGRAKQLVNNYMAEKEDICSRLLQESEEDSEVLVLKRDLAYQLRNIFGPENWKICREWFPMLKDYWGD